MEVRVVADYGCQCGENPLWHPMEKRIYWTDIPTGRLFWYEPGTGRHEQCYQGRPVGGFTIQADGSLLLFMDRGTVAIWREGRIQRTVIEELPDERETRFNDVIADPEGRVFCGTMPTRHRPGRLYRLDPDGSIHLLLEGIGCSNGLGFTRDGRGLYHTDTVARRIYLFDYDRTRGGITNRRVFIEVPAGEGGPDGMTVDSRGHIWSARWDGWGVFHYDERGQFVEKLAMPAKKVSSVIFGGEDYRDLYVTTAGGHKKEENGAAAGALLHVRMEVAGVPEYFSRIGL